MTTNSGVFSTEILHHYSYDYHNIITQLNNKIKSDDINNGCELPNLLENKNKIILLKKMIHLKFVLLFGMVIISMMILVIFYM